MRNNFYDFEYEQRAEKRFLSRIILTNTGCWEWMGATDTKGYGRMVYRGKIVGTHQYAYIHYVGNRNGLCVCHHCDNPPCCNPDHLFLGTQLENIRDCSKKGRMKNNGKHIRGEGNPKAKLSRLDIPIIKSMFIPYKMSCAKIARLYGVNTSTIQRIIYNKSWVNI